jgi:hypothetical protein
MKITKVSIFIFTLILLSYAQVQFSVHITPPPLPPPPEPPTGFVVLSSDDDDMNRSDLMVIGPGQVGFWVQDLAGRYTLSCRSMQYDRSSSEWFYGPWHKDHMTYDQYRRSSFYNTPFNTYMKEKYPHYYDRRCNRQKHEWKEEKQRDDRQDRNWNDKRHDDRRDWDKRHDDNDKDRRR